MSPENLFPKIIRGAVAVALISAAAIFAIPSVSARNAQDSTPTKDPMAGMNMDDMKPMEQNTDAGKAATGAMSDDDMGGMHMDAHMHMTDLRPANPGDQKRADDILAQLRPAIEKYKDYKVALADGYRIFGPKVP